MEALAWWLIPITATLLAVAWVTWINRPRKPADAHSTLAAHRRFTAALERSEVGGGAHKAGEPNSEPAGSADEAPSPTTER